MNTPTIVESIHETLKRVRAEIARLQAMEASLSLYEKEGVLPQPATNKPAKAGKSPKGKRLKAPKGTLANAILTALKDGPKTNKELRTTIGKSGYKYALAGENVRQVCQQLRNEKKITAEGEGQGMKYALAK